MGQWVEVLLLCSGTEADQIAFTAESGVYAIDRDV